MKTKATAAAYLSAMIDGEGYVEAPGIPGPKGALGKRRAVTIVNSDMEIIEACARCLNVLGVVYTITKAEPQGRGRKDMFRVRVGRTADIAVLAKWCPVQVSGKLARLQAAAIPTPPRPPRVSTEDLHRMYHREGVTVSEIARRYGVTKAAVYQWLNTQGVGVRSQSEAQTKRWSEASDEDKAAKLRQLAGARWRNR